MSHFPLLSPPGGFLGSVGWSGDGFVPDVARVLVWFWQLHFPLSVPFPGVWDPLLALCHHTLLLYDGAGAASQLLH